MVDGNNSCLNREEHFVKGDLFDVYNYQVFLYKTQRRKNVVFSSFDGIITVHYACCGGRDTFIHYDDLRVGHFKRFTSKQSGVKNDSMTMYSESQKENMKKIVIRHPHLFTEYSVCYLYLIPIRIVKGCIENGEMENERPEAMCFSGRIQPIL